MVDCAIHCNAETPKALHIFALFLSMITFVPLDDRPVTLQLPVLLGRIAGVQVKAPPRALLGRYLRPGDPDKVERWLNAPANAHAQTIVVSTDMLAYGGLVASRLPDTAYDAAYFRLHSLEQLRASHPHAWIAGFGTIMRLAPTGVPAIGAAASFFAAYPIWTYLQQYADLHDPLLPSEAASAAHLRTLAGPALDEYLNARLRSYGADHYLLDLVANGTLDRLVLGQDDAGPVGLHVPEVKALRTAVAQKGIAARTAIEPGADELGMVLIAHALARSVHWTPRIAVRYSAPDGGSYQDPLEFVPISVTISNLIALVGGQEVQSNADIDLDVRVPHTSPSLDDAFVAELHRQLAANRSVALADESFLAGNFRSQHRFARGILSDGIASHLDAYASWNTDANTVGTALAEAVAAGVGRRNGTYNALAHREFTFMRFVDDDAFHTVVRPQLNAALDAQGITDHTYLLPSVAAESAQLNSALLWNRAESILGELYPNDHIAAMRITLPWQRTFETKISVGLAPNLSGSRE